MSDFGLKVVGDSGNFQIYKNELNYGLLMKGNTFVRAGEGQPSNFTEVNLGISIQSSALLFIRPTIDNIPVYGFIWQNGLMFTTGARSVNVNWYIFDIVSNVASSNDSYGLRVWDESGRLSFTSSSKMLKIVGIGKASDIGQFPTSLPPKNINIGYGRMLAGSASNFRGFIDGEGPPEGGGPYSNFHYDGIYVNSSNVGVSEIVTGTIMTGSQVVTKSGGVIIAADVTGI